MPALNEPNSTAALAAKIIDIYTARSGFRARVDAIYDAVKGQPETTVVAALVVALASKEVSGDAQQLAR